MKTVNEARRTYVTRALEDLWLVVLQCCGPRLPNAESNAETVEVRSSWYVPIHDSN